MAAAAGEPAAAPRPQLQSHPCPRADKRSPGHPGSEKHAPASSCPTEGDRTPPDTMDVDFSQELLAAHEKIFANTLRATMESLQTLFKEQQKALAESLLNTVAPGRKLAMSAGSAVKQPPQAIDVAARAKHRVSVNTTTSLARKQTFGSSNSSNRTGAALHLLPGYTPLLSSGWKLAPRDMDRGLGNLGIGDIIRPEGGSWGLGDFVRPDPVVVTEPSQAGTAGEPVVGSSPFQDCSPDYSSARSWGSPRLPPGDVISFDALNVRRGSDDTFGSSTRIPLGVKIGKVETLTVGRESTAHSNVHDFLSVILEKHQAEVQVHESLRQVHRNYSRLEDVRGYLQRQRARVFHMDREDRQKQSMGAAMVEMLLRPVHDNDQVATPLLDVIMSLIVVVNIILIGLSTDIDRDWRGWFYFDLVFACCYLMEFLLKMRFAGWYHYFRGPDFVINGFDFVLMVLAWGEVCFKVADGDSQGAHLLQLVRMIRVTKILRICRLGMFADMLMMINGAIGSFRTLIYSIFLITLPLYVVSLVFHELLQKHSEEGGGAEAFDTLALSGFNMFLCIVANECSSLEGKPIFSQVVANYGWYYGVIYCFTVMFMTFGLYNVIVAIYVENIVSAAKLTARKSKRRRLLDSEFFEEKCLQVLRYISEMNLRQKQELSQFQQATQAAEPQPLSTAADIVITPALLTGLFQQEDFCRLLRELDIADEDMIDLFETLDVNANGEIDAKELIVGLARLRGEFRRSDIIGVSLVLRSMQEFMMDMDLHLQALQLQQKDLQNSQSGIQQQRIPSSQKSPSHGNLIPLNPSAAVAEKVIFSEV
mmetsp:Transcript_57792/g.137595  ORF Transcript_57792/g.137595 Transcript_57792/m.137595 type:complete len:818 (-) Transcript_57792:192-2645(-)